MILTINDVIFRRISNVRMVNDQVGHHRKDVKRLNLSTIDCLLVHLGGQSEPVTNYVVTKTTTDPNDDENIEVTKKTRAAKKRKTTSTTRSVVFVTKLARNLVTLPISALMENTECTFQGNMPDPDNCQGRTSQRLFSCSSLRLAYYTCKDDVITRAHCPDRQLFDEDNRLCNDYRKVFCANRPINERGIDPCKTKRIFHSIIKFEFHSFRYWSTEWLVCGYGDSMSNLLSMYRTT